MVAHGDYKWTLRRGGGKMICPACGRKRFVPYVASADGRTLATNEQGECIYGRCDRQDNCGYHLHPSQVSTDGIKRVEREPEQPIRFFPSVVRTDIKTKLFDYACTKIGVRKAMDVWEAYRIGRDGSRTMFWQLARDGSVRSGKSIPYLANGHRDKSDRMPASWAHKSPTFRGQYTGTALEQCFFGEHLLDRFPMAGVAIVESEKTAALMAGCSNGWVWLASGGAQGLSNEDKNKALEGRNVILLPDNGQYWKWRAIADAHGWKITDVFERYPLFEGCDILDYLDAGIFKRKEDTLI